MSEAARPDRGAWVAVVLMIVGFTICTGAFMARLLWLGIVGGVIGAIGIVVGKAVHIMEQTH